MRPTVLIIDGDAAHAVAMMECLVPAGYDVSVLCHDKMSYGYHSRLASQRFLGPDSRQPEVYLNFLVDLLSSHRFDVLMPTSDATAEIMSRHKDILSQYTSVLMPAIEVFMKAYDKNRLMNLCSRRGYPHPHTVDLSECAIDSAIVKQFPYPALLKPNITSGARGMTRVNNYEELLQVFPGVYDAFGPCHLQRFINPGGRQVKIQVFTDADGNPLYSSAIWKQRYYPVNGGSSCCNVTVDEPDYVSICASVLKDIGWYGFADFDLIEDPDTGQLLIMEINPRTPACIRSVYKSGIDYATMIADASLGRPSRNYNYTPGIRLRHLGFEMLWFMKSDTRWKARPSWFRFLAKDTYYQDWVKGNFLSFIYGTVGNIFKILNPEFRRSKSGMS